MPARSNIGGRMQPGEARPADAARRRARGRAARRVLALTAAALCLLAAAAAANWAGPAAARDAGAVGMSGAGLRQAHPAAHEAATHGRAGGASAPAAARRAAAGDGLTVALFPWVPRPEQVEQALAAAWQQLHPGVPLRFIFWDCYSSDPPPGVDVFVYDAILLDDFVARGLVRPLSESDVQDASDILPFARRSARGDDGKLYGIPMYGCASLLFYRRGDTALAQATDLEDVVRAVGPARYRQARPPKGKGLLVDLSDPNIDSCLYVEALEDTYGTYTGDPPLAPAAAKLDPWALDNVRDLRVMAGRRQASLVTESQFTRSRWFADGSGRALITFSEGLCDMTAAARATVQMKVMPLSERGSVRLFYTDLVSLDPALSGEQRTLALDLAGLACSTDVMVAATGPSADDPTPQYLFAVRRSVYDELAPRYPLLGRMYELIGAPEGSGAEPNPYRLGPGARHWLKTVGPAIKRLVLAP